MENKIYIIGLGAGDIEQLPLGVYRLLSKQAYPLYLRTEDHPVVRDLRDEGITFQTFDSLYERYDSFSDVYNHICDELLTCAKESSIVYAVPGHPMLAEQVVQQLNKQENVPIQMIGGQSYLDAMFTALKIDPIDGFQFVDATAFDRSILNYEQHLIFCQVYDQWTASEVKLALLEDLPADHEVTIVDGAGTKAEQIKKCPLAELDHDIEVSNLMSVYVPPVERSVLTHTFKQLRDVIQTLRSPEGCPWDRKQTHESLRPYAIEEVYELIDAIEEEDDEGIVEELGDVLLQVMLHSQIGEDDGYFSIDDVISRVTEKMIHRHPHVFAKGTAAAEKSWDELKAEENFGRKEKTHYILSDIPKAFPALIRAEKIQKKAAKVGFDWTDVADVWAKIEEEIKELQEAIASADEAEMTAEFGDVLFALVNLGRFYKIKAELALNETNEKFISRFNYVEEAVRNEGKQLTDVSLEEMDRFWEAAKESE